MGTPLPDDSSRHPFLRSPHRTFFSLSVPVLVSLVAEPLTGLADTAFISRLGAAPLAALGVGTIVLSSVFWIFNFLMEMALRYASKSYQTKRFLVKSALFS